MIISYLKVDMKRSLRKRNGTESNRHNEVDRRHRFVQIGNLQIRLPTSLSVKSADMHFDETPLRPSSWKREHIARGTDVPPEDATA